MKKVKEFIEYFRKKKSQISLVVLVHEILEKSGLIYQAVAKTGGRNSRMMANLMKFITIARNFERRNIFSDISDFADYLRELEEVRILEPEAKPKVPDIVHLMSIHQSKGLEFEVVFISNLSCMNFPQPAKMPRYHFHKEGEMSAAKGLIIRDTDEYNEILKKKLYSNHNQEERRLLYVAMTRMKKHLFITGNKNKKGNISKFMEYFLVQKESGYVLKEKLKDYIQLQTKNNIQPASPPISVENKKLDRKEIFGLAKEIGIPKFFREKTIKKEFSVTELLTYNQCPKQYNYLIRMKIPKPPVEKQFSSLLFGSAVHRMLEEYYRFGEINETAAMKNKIASLIITSGVNDKDYKKFYRDSTEEIVSNLLNSNILKSSKSVIYTEKPFVLKIGDIFIKGTIDRVDKYSGGVELIDYKTSKNEDISGYLIQMGIYKMALEKIFNFEVKRISICFLRTKNIKIIIPLLFMEERINSLINGIRNEIFPPARSEKNCRYCSYKSLCG